MFQDDGMPARSFEDRLRALGWLLDRHDFRAIRLVADSNGVVIQARRGSAETGTLSELRMTSADVVRLCRTAQRRRTNMAQPSAFEASVMAQLGSTQPVGQAWQFQQPSYQDMLRQIGRTLDQGGAGVCEIEEQDAAFMLRFTRSEGGRNVEQDQRVYKEALGLLIAGATRRRGRRLRAGAA